MFLSAQHLPQSAEALARGRPCRHQETFLRPPQPHERIVTPRGGDGARLDRADQCFERARLQVEVTTADQDAVAAGANGFDGLLRYRIARADGRHLKVVTQDHALEAELVPQQGLNDLR